MIFIGPFLRYENEARLRIEDVDALKKKFGAQIAQLQDQLDAVQNKMKALDQQKNRLQTEVTVLIKDLEVTNSEFASAYLINLKFTYLIHTGK